MKILKYLATLFSFLFLNIPVVAAEVPVESGVSLQLARLRSGTLSDIHYDLFFNLPSDKAEKVTGRVAIDFIWSGNENLEIDFQGEFNGSCTVNGQKQTADYYNEHILIKKEWLKSGANKVELAFTSNDKSLNRNADYMYTLFVPDHARSVFPCFDQPNLKARFGLTLSAPSDWQVASAAKRLDTSPVGITPKEEGKQLVRFSETELIPTYLFSFVAGRFQKAAEDRDGQTVNIYYRETDAKKLAQLPEVFNEIFHSINWLESYTGIKLPFQKYDAVILPGFQFGGMEHVGLIQFNDKRIFTGEHPTPDEELARMELIAHETSHLWFGDLVTMQWFNDVWTKEVFANLMASKISNELFTAINHDLNFVRSYNVTALAEDRTQGTHPIQQELDNLNSAGLLYGNIIYDKAPVMMRGLEEQMGSQAFKAGIQAYLKKFAYANATWDDLISIFSQQAPSANLPQFSEVWVKQKGMPTITFSLQPSSDKAKTTIIAEQHDVYSRDIIWPQRFFLGLVLADGSVMVHDVDMRHKTERIEAWVDHPVEHIIPNWGGLGYARFVSSQQDLVWQMENWHKTADDIARLAMIMNIHEARLSHQITSAEAFKSLCNGVENEENALIASTCADCLVSEVEAMDMGASERQEAEWCLWNLAESHPVPSCRQKLTRALFALATDSRIINTLYGMWQNQTGSLLNQNDYTNLCYELALRMPASWEQILATQRARLSRNADLLREFDFISRACNPSQEAQQELFNTLLEPANRAVEPWVRRLLALLNSPLREPGNNCFIGPGLDELLEVKQTGDIFFPKNWVASLLGGHRSDQARQLVLDFINTHPDYPKSLSNKLLQAAYHLLDKQ